MSAKRTKRSLLGHNATLSFQISLTSNGNFLMTQLNQASVVCPHVLKSLKNAELVCHTSDGWSAGCSWECLDKAGPATAGMVCLGCFLDIPKLPADFHLLPTNFAYFKRGGNWESDYFSPYFEPDEGEFIAAPQGHKAHALKPKDEVFALELPSSELVKVFLHEGIWCIPFWMEPALPPDFQEQLEGSESFKQMRFSRVEQFARSQSVKYLAVDFLCGPHDLALQVSPRPNE